MSRTNSQRRYDKRYTRMISLKLNRRTDKDILQVLEQCENKNGYIKKALREKIQKEES